jgi:hypothetical protein
MSILLNKKINIIPKHIVLSSDKGVSLTPSMKDKFNIIKNDVEHITVEEISSLIDNYFENLLYSNERVIHSDLISQILWFRKDFDSSVIILRHLENYLKEKKTSIRNSIKKGTFEIDSGLNSLIKNYFDKIHTCSTFVSDNERIVSYGLSQLYNQIITDPSLLTFLKSEISSLDESNVQSISKLTSVMKKISEANPDIKSYQWFLFLISSSIGTIAEETNNKSYPVPENYQRIINFRENLSLYQKVEILYSYVGSDIHIILNGIVNIMFGTFIEIMKTCSMLELYYLIKNYKKVFETIFNHENILIQGKNMKETFTNQFFIFIERNEKGNKIELKNLVKCFQTINGLLSPSGTSRDFINTKISGIFSNESAQNYLLDIINRNISCNNGCSDNDLYNLLSFCSNIKDKDLFIDKYNRLLINRILHKPNISSERNYYAILHNKFGDKLLHKTNKILTDMEYTLQDRENFIKIADVIKKENKPYQHSIGYNCNDIVDVMNVVTSSFNNWDVNQSEGIVGVDMLTAFKNDYILSNMMYVYSKFYESRYQNKRKLNWYPHFGEIVFDFKGTEFKMLPIQFMVVEHIFKMNEISKDDLINFQMFAGYNEHFRKSIVSSLLLGGIIQLNESKIKINPDISSVTTNYVDLFFTSSGYADVWNARRESELALSREDILSTCINHFIKKEPCDKTVLLSKIQKSMDLFDFNSEFLEKVINDMIKKDYIKYNEDKLEKIVW